MIHHFNGWEWHSEARQIFASGFAVDVKDYQARLMTILAMAHPRPVPTEYIRMVIMPRSKKDHVNGLIWRTRKKMALCTDATIEHVAGYGYRFTK